MTGPRAWRSTGSAALTADPRADCVAIAALNRICAPDLPPAFPELSVLLDQMEGRRDALRQAIRDRQREALSTLSDGAQAASAKVLLAILDRLDPVWVDDSIADLRAGRPVAPPQADPPDPARLFARIGVTGIRIDGRRDAVPGRRCQFAMTCDIPHRDDGVPPPAIGSVARGRYFGFRVIPAWAGNTG